jgi:hypothetical protein
VIVLLCTCILGLHSGFGTSVFDNLLRFSKFQVGSDRNNVLLALKLREITTPDAVLAVGWAGAPAYFSERYCVDVLGKNDKVLARKKTRATTVHNFDPGHHKLDMLYSLDHYKPDIVLDYNKEWYTSAENSYFQKHYRVFRIPAPNSYTADKSWTIYARKDSKHIDWTRGKVSEVL